MDDRYTLLSPFLTARRKQRFEDVLSQRTNWVTAVIEDLFDPHNTSAVLRSCDGFGIQTAHIIEVKNRYQLSSGVAKGAEKWLDIERHTDTTHALRDLKSRGYVICCTTPHADDTTPDKMPIERPVALIFGSEGSGISHAAIAEADLFVRIPMFGFTESFNISVAAALTLQTVTRRVRSRQDLNWSIPPDDRLRILGDWASRTVKDAQNLIERLRNGDVPPWPNSSGPH